MDYLVLHKKYKKLFQNKKATINPKDDKIFYAVDNNCIISK